MHFQELKQNKCMKAQIVFFLVNGYILPIRCKKKSASLLYNVLNNSHIQIGFTTGCGEQPHIYRLVLEKGGRKVLY